MAKRRPTPASTEPRTEKPSIIKALADADPMTIYAETTRWKDKCADLLDSLRSIKNICNGSLTDLSKISNIRRECHKALDKFTNQG